LLCILAAIEVGGNLGHKKGEEGGKKGSEEERKASKASLRFHCTSSTEETKHTWLHHTMLSSALVLSKSELYNHPILQSL
jgi:hypothetical protein